MSLRGVDLHGASSPAGEGRVRQGRNRGQAPNAASGASREFAKKIEEVVGPALEEHPGDVPLVVAYKRFLEGQALQASQVGDAAGAAEFLTQTDAMLDRALQVNAEHPSPDLCLVVARFKLDRFILAHPNPAPAELADLRPEIERIATLARQATELDPAVFEGYNLQAELMQRFAVGPDGAELTPEERAAKSLEIYEAAKDRTLTLRNLRRKSGKADC